MHLILLTIYDLLFNSYLKNFNIFFKIHNNHQILEIIILNFANYLLVNEIIDESTARKLYITMVVFKDIKTF